MLGYLHSSRAKMQNLSPRVQVLDEIYILILKELHCWPIIYFLRLKYVRPTRLLFFFFGECRYFLSSGLLHNLFLPRSVRQQRADIQKRNKWFFPLVVLIMIRKKNTEKLDFKSLIKKTRQNKRKIKFLFTNVLWSFINWRLSPSSVMNSIFKVGCQSVKIR